MPTGSNGTCWTGQHQHRAAAQLSQHAPAGHAAPASMAASCHRCAAQARVQNRKDSLKYKNKCFGDLSGVKVPHWTQWEAHNWGVGLGVIFLKSICYEGVKYLASFKDSRSRSLEFVRAEVIGIFKVFAAQEEGLFFAQTKARSPLQRDQALPSKSLWGYQGARRNTAECGSTTEPWRWTTSTFLAPAVPLPALKAAVVWGQCWPRQLLHVDGQVTAQEECKALGLVQDQHLRVKRKPQALGRFGPLNDCSMLPPSLFFPSCYYCNLWNHLRFR